MKIKMEKKMPYLVIILIQLIYSGMYFVSKAAFNVGMNTFIFVFYRQILATLFLAPIAAFYEWRNGPPLSLKTFCKMFMLSFCGITVSMNIYGVALVYTSATLAAAIANCNPVITFFIALLLRVEQVKLKTRGGIAKVAGIAFCTIGALILAFYKGPYLKLYLHHQLFTQQHIDPHSSPKTWIKGVFLMLFSGTLWCFWLVLQARVMEFYPSKLLFTSLQCFLCSIQSFIIAIALERDASQWKLGWNIKLFAVAYCGIVVSGITLYLIAWVIEKKGAVFFAMSTPMALIITLFFSLFLLGESISFGSLLGGIFLVGGLYSVLWGKSKEQAHNEAEEKIQESKEMYIQSPPA